MRGTVYKRVLESGRIVWDVQLDAGRDEHGQRIRTSRNGFRRKGDAEKELGRMLQERNEGLTVTPSPKTFGEFLKEWFREHAERNCTPKTVERYRELADYVLPHLQKVSLQELSALMLERLYNRLKDSGGRGRKKKAARPLSAKTVRHIAGVVHVALGTAVRWKLLKSNPADAVQLPKVEKKEAKALDADGLAWYLDAARVHCNWLYPVLLVTGATGCRRGELSALRWLDLDLINGVMRVCRSLEQTRSGLRLKLPKNGKTRVLSLPATVVEALGAHRERQKKNRELFGPDYRTDLDLVFCDPQGEYLKPDSLTAKACLIARKAGLKGIGLHSLHHSHGSQLLSAGVPLPTVSKRLGHLSVYTTATIYSHALSGDELAAAEIWDTAVGKRIANAGQPQKIS